MTATTTITVHIERDFDGKWAARWPSDVVARGESAGAGRHTTQRDLAAALDARGWRITGRDGRTWTLERGPTYGGRDFDTETLFRQIGVRTVLGVSGGRWERLHAPGSGTTRPVGVRLSAGKGYRVDVLLADDDTYTVRRVFVRGGREWIKGEETGVHADQVSDAVWRASCYVDVNFGEHEVNR